MLFSLLPRLGAAIGLFLFAAPAPRYPYTETPADAGPALCPAGWLPARGSGGGFVGRGLPLLPVGTPARLYNGQLKNNQAVAAAVVDIDPGTTDLQQCADAVMRLRAEYLFSENFTKIHFHLTTGYDAWFSDFVAGTTFAVHGEEVMATPKISEAPTHAALMRYLLPVFGYAGTRSLGREVRPVPLEAAQPGDVLVHGGSPGHAVLVADVAENPRTGQRYLLLTQSYMPAQQIHLLRNINQPTLGAWFAVPGPTVAEMSTPKWTFGRGELGRFQ